MLKYTTTPYGIEPQGEVFSGKPMNTAPTNSTQPVPIFDADGLAYLAMFHRGSWHKTETIYDLYSGKTRLTMSGETIAQPVGWAKE
jgi:hypothetical protein